MTDTDGELASGKALQIEAFLVILRGA